MSEYMENNQTAFQVSNTGMPLQETKDITDHIFANSALNNPQCISQTNWMIRSSQFGQQVGQLGSNALKRPQYRRMMTRQSSIKSNNSHSGFQIEKDEIIPQTEFSPLPAFGNMFIKQSNKIIQNKLSLSKQLQADFQIMPKVKVVQGVSCCERERKLLDFFIDHLTQKLKEVKQKTIKDFNKGICESVINEEISYVESPTNKQPNIIQNIKSKKTTDKPLSNIEMIKEFRYALDRRQIQELTKVYDIVISRKNQIDQDKSEGIKGNLDRKMRRNFASNMIKNYKRLFGKIDCEFDNKFDQIFLYLTSEKGTCSFDKVKQIVRGMIENPLTTQPDQDIDLIYNEENLIVHNAWFKKPLMAIIWLLSYITRDRSTTISYENKCRHDHIEIQFLIKALQTIETELSGESELKQLMLCLKENMNNFDFYKLYTADSNAIFQMTRSGKNLDQQPCRNKRQNKRNTKK